MNSFLISLFLTCLTSSFALYNVDTQAALTTDQLACLAGKFDTFISRVYDPAGFIDETGIQNIKNALQVRLDLYGDVYMSPCVSGNCQNNLTAAADQVDAVISRLNQEFKNSGVEVFLWISIEKGNWSKNHAQNQQFIMDLLRTAQENNAFAGVLTSQHAWTSVVGNSFTNASILAPDLWWVNWNGKPDFSGFTPFGGWNKTFYHQYAGGVTTNNCAQGIPLDYTYW